MVQQPPAAAPSPSAGPKTLRVTSVDAASSPRLVQVTVNGQLFQVRPGDVFSDEFRLETVVDDRCAKFVHGEDGFTLCLGDADRTF